MPELYAYQKKALLFALKKKACYLAIDMGLGKTAIALHWAQEALKRRRGVLVVAPLRTVHTTWPDEIAKWTPLLTYTILHGPNKNDRINKQVDLYIINYEGLDWLFKTLKRVFKITNSVPFRAAILDEGSMIKSSSTKRFKVIRKIKDIFPEYRMILSGTPAPRSLMDLWSQYYFLDSGERLGSTFSGFRSRYFYSVDYKNFIWLEHASSKQTIYDKISDVTYRLDSDDYANLPKYLNRTIKIKLNKTLLAKYKALEKTFFLDLQESTVEAFTAAALSMKLRQFLQGAVYTGERVKANLYRDSTDKLVHYNPYTIVHKEKLKVLKSLVEEANGTGILCAIQFRFELDMIKEAYPDVAIISGGINNTEAVNIIRNWNKGNIPLLVCHPASLSHGVNLQMGSHIIVWYGLPWNLEHYLQLNARLRRLGQKHAVIVHHLVIENSLDQQVERALNAKFKNQKELLDYLKGLV